MKIIGGNLKGRFLVKPRILLIRPTRERIRENIFNILQNYFKIDLCSSRVLDLFSGTGSLGIEALSRGAKNAFFVEKSSILCSFLKRNIQRLNLSKISKILQIDATSLGQLNESVIPFNLVFLDPPYKKQLNKNIFMKIFNRGWIQKETLIVEENDRNSKTIFSHPCVIKDERFYGRTLVRFYKISFTY